MIDLPKHIPDVDVLLALQPEELASRLLFLFQERQKTDHNWLPNLNNVQGAAFSRRSDGIASYPDARHADVHQALAEAWSWLEAQGLLVRAPGPNGNSGFRLLSRRARAFSDPREFTNFTIARRLPKEALDPRIADTVWQAFMRAEYDVAVFQAMKAVEVTVRVAAGLSAKDIGTALIRKAFDPETGPLTDTSVEKSEREALAHLFAALSVPTRTRIPTVT
jgi:Protein of unknown function (Hypoth_ymh)